MFFMASCFVLRASCFVLETKMSMSEFEAKVPRARTDSRGKFCRVPRAERCAVTRAHTGDTVAPPVRMTVRSRANSPKPTQTS